MQALQRFGALVLADLRERSRSRQFWIVLAAMMLLAWWSLPPQEAAYRILVLDGGARGQLSSAWVGMVLAMAFNLTLNLGGFYLVRGTLVRDIETRVWQLLVATPMTRGGFLLAKWASHMVVFGLIVSLSLAVGLVGQWVRAEDRHIDLIELVKPVLLLSVPGFAFTSMLAVWFDLVPWLRRTAGNIIFFILWVSILGVFLAPLERPGASLRTSWLSDPNGMAMAARDFHRVREAQTGKSQPYGFSIGSPAREHEPAPFQWKHWDVRPMDIVGRVLWLAISIIGVLLAAPLLDWAAARGLSARQKAGSGKRLRWLDRLLAPWARGRLGVLVVAELKTWLRERGTWWWLLVLAALGLQAFGTPRLQAAALLLAWILPLELLARGVLRESAHRTGALVFSASGILPRLLTARFIAALSLLAVLSLPAIIRLPVAGAVAIVVVCASIASWGLALGALCRNPRPFELLLVATFYVALQGSSLFDVQSGAWATASIHALGLLPAWLLLAWRWPKLAVARIGGGLGSRWPKLAVA
ncbi:ABC transporter permease [soil metagenome]